MATLYSSLKFLRFSDRLEALRSGDVAAPVHIRIKPTNRCNHNCWYCAYRTDDLKLGEDMDEGDSIPEAKMMEIVEDVLEMGVKAVTFSGGGEPLLYKPLPNVIERLAAGGVKVATLTNGSNLRGRVGEALARHATWVRVSVDAWDDASYMASRGAKDGEFSRLLENMRAFVATGTTCVLGVSLIVGHENHQRIAEICKLFRDVGVNHVKLSAAVVANDVHANNLYHRALMAAVTAQIHEAKALETPSFKVLNHYHETEERFEKGYTSCPFLQFLTVIGGDQCVYTCQDKAYTASGKLGSLVGRRFKDFWFSPENRERLHCFDPSRECRHHCVTHAKNLAILEYLALDPDHGMFV
ncbi:radical SAM protein [Paramagnetospirillum magneticum]|uniref:Predicted Fe-S oxidoreductase n=1 Tax=Paramagnetospirillum magneticum (strain ATCC 700264 / AMB-1) TaxID=342108 RepID=Q2WBA1_PARM1|nr:radical SAM protein [Paramagnetospirillum magneticum]BAE48874.1 Predicted Fe-S oxidoreductase [Paramagnetospirillum magneticum AMB-1]